MVRNPINVKLVVSLTYQESSFTSKAATTILKKLFKTDGSSWENPGENDPTNVFGETNDYLNTCFII